MQALTRSLAAILITILNGIMAHALPLSPLPDGPNDKAGAGRSDSVDILHTTISLDMTDFTGKRIAGNCELRFTPRVNNLTYLALDLLELEVDSVLYQGNRLTFNYNDTLLNINLPLPLGPSDTTAVTVFYGGQPVRDASWGGFYYSGNYAFNLGVGFAADPHNYGRVWFPCFDNFVERSAYTFHIRTAGGKKAHCNGALTGEVSLGGDTLLRSWEMTEPIPSYLVCVAVADYATVRMSHAGMNGPVPVELAARAVDTTNVKSSFLHLPEAIDAFEAAYGPYLFNKVGYSIVPFNAGAMEHATNIAYPLYAVNGSLSYETLMAHELAHHWWGDLVTCDRAGEMWINEGMASYSEHLFLEHTYGKERYREAVLQNHSDVLQYAHIREGSYRAITGLPHNYTYGMHVYDKGASVAHTLRGYLGDSLFFSGLKTFLSGHAFSDVNSELLRDELISITGTDLTDFFQDWVFNPGFPHFSIDSFVVTPATGNFNITVYVRQKKRGAPDFYKNVPMEISFRDSEMKKYSEKAMLSGEFSVLNFTLPVQPVFAALNTDDKINQAVTAAQLMIRDTGNYTFDLARMNVEVKEVADSSWLRVEHHWIAPDALKQGTDQPRLSDYRYWKVDGVWEEGFRATATVYFDGRNITSGGAGHLDFDLLRMGEDSLLLMHRPGPGEEWREFRHYRPDGLSSPSDRYGKIMIDSLLKGEYTLAKGHTVIGIPSEEEEQGEGILIFPNPADDHIRINIVREQETLLIAELYDMEGRVIEHRRFSGSTAFATAHLSTGTYMVVISRGDRRLKSEKIVIN